MNAVLARSYPSRRRRYRPIIVSLRRPVLPDAMFLVSVRSSITRGDLAPRTALTSGGGIRTVWSEEQIACRKPLSEARLLLIDLNVELHVCSVDLCDLHVHAKFVRPCGERALHSFAGLGCKIAWALDLVRLLSYLSL